MLMLCFTEVQKVHSLSTQANNNEAALHCISSCLFINTWIGISVLNFHVSSCYDVDCQSKSWSDKETTRLCNDSHPHCLWKVCIQCRAKHWSNLNMQIKVPNYMKQQIAKLRHRTACWTSRSKLRMRCNSLLTIYNGENEKTHKTW